MSQNVAEKVRELAIPLAADLGYEVIDVTFAREGADWRLRVVIDKRGGVGVDDCERMSKAISPALDDENVINRAYILEVSSPGLDRPLKTDADFRRYEGESVDITALPGRLKAGAANKAGETGGEANPAGEAGSNSAANKRSAARKTGEAGRGGGDKLTGILNRLEGGRVYITDAGGNDISIALEDIKTVKRTVKFK